jgi:hypothetical protein
MSITHQSAHDRAVLDQRRRVGRHRPGVVSFSGSGSRILRSPAVNAASEERVQILLAITGEVAAANECWAASLAAPGTQQIGSSVQVAGRFLRREERRRRQAVQPDKSVNLGRAILDCGGHRSLASNLIEATNYTYEYVSVSNARLPKRNIQSDRQLPRRHPAMISS